jgi:hypothetical protein
MKQTEEREADQEPFPPRGQPPPSFSRAVPGVDYERASNPYNAYTDVFWTLFNSSEFVFIG